MILWLQKKLDALLGRKVVRFKIRGKFPPISNQFSEVLIEVFLTWIKETNPFDDPEEQTEELNRLKFAADYFEFIRPGLVGVRCKDDIEFFDERNLKIIIENRKAFL